MTDKTTHKPGCEALGGYGHGIGPCSCSEAQPEALAVAEELDSTRNAFGDDNAQSKRRAAAELRRQHAEIQQLKAERDLRAVERDGANERVRLMLNAKNQWMDRAKAAEAQLSARQAAPDGWRLVPELPTLNMLNTAFGICTENGRPVQKMIEAAAGKYAAMLSAAPPAPEREPLSETEVRGLLEFAGYWPGEDAQRADFINGLRHGEMAHGIGATVENLQASLGTTK